MSHKDDLEMRKNRNEQLIKRMKAGESLWAFDSKSSWFPPRPIIEKDPEAIKRLYNSSNQAGYSDPTVRHIESRLKLIAGDKKTKAEEVG